MKDTNENDEKHQLHSESSSNSNILEDRWLIRECAVYKDEYKECTSFRGRFHQYFIWGETLDCRQWKKDYDNCCKFHDKADVGAAARLIESERERRAARLRGHRGNTVWKPRNSPPSDWDRALPAWITERDANTYLAIKSKELREGEPSLAPEQKSYCTIL